jgi:sugar/nucleoside kinase (ribokinase family)
MVAEFKGASWKIRDPKLVVRKAARVARPGGTVVIFDADYATMTSGVDREMDERIISGVIANPRVVDSRAWVLTEIGASRLLSYPCSHIPSSCRRQAERLLRRPKHLSPDSCVQAKKARFSLDTISMQ